MGNACPCRRGLPAAQGPQTIRSRPLLSSRAVCLLAALLAGTGCGGDDDGPMAAPTALRVIVFGDMPYVEPDTPSRDSLLGRYAAVLDTIAAESVSFVVHIGDITALTCSDSLFLERRREFECAAAPGHLHPRRQRMAGLPIRDVRPVRAAGEAARAVRGGGPQPGRPAPVPGTTEREPALRRVPRERALDREQRHVPHRARRRLQQRARAGCGASSGVRGTERREPGMAAGVVRGGPARGSPRHRHHHARQPDRGLAADRPDEVNGLIETRDEIRALAAEFGKPGRAGARGYARVPGRPPPARRRGNLLANVIRAETFGWPALHALIMTVDPSGSELFTFEPLIVRGNALH